MTFVELDDQKVDDIDAIDEHFCKKTTLFSTLNMYFHQKKEEIVSLQKY